MKRLRIETKKNRMESNLYVTIKQMENAFDQRVAAIKSLSQNSQPANSYLFKVNNRNTRKRCEICSKLTTKTPERLQ